MAAQIPYHLPLSVRVFLSYDGEMAVLAIVEDLFFRAKIEAAAKHVGTSLTMLAAIDEKGVEFPAGSWQLVMVDLHGSIGDPIQTVSTLRRIAPTVPILGFASHVDTDLQARARAAGCTEVLPRSAFVHRLPELLAGK